jgi:hypothetical protein
MEYRNLQELEQAWIKRLNHCAEKATSNLSLTLWYAVELLRCVVEVVRTRAKRIARGICIGGRIGSVSNNKQQ